MKRIGLSLLGVVIATAAPFFATATASAAPGDAGSASVRFEIGTFNRDHSDWPIVAVVVTGDLLEGELVAVRLRNRNDEIVWEGEADFHSPTLRIAVQEFVGVGSVDGAEIAQQGFGAGPTPEIPGETDPPIDSQPPETVIDPLAPQVLGEIVGPLSQPGQAKLLDPSAAVVLGEFVASPLNPSVDPKPNTAPGVIGAAPGGARLAVLLIVIIMIFMLAFRLPLLPLGTTARWRK